MLIHFHRQCPTTKTTTRRKRLKLSWLIIRNLKAGSILPSSHLKGLHHFLLQSRILLLIHTSFKLSHQPSMPSSLNIMTSLIPCILLLDMAHRMKTLCWLKIRGPSILWVHAQGECRTSRLTCQALVWQNLKLPRKGRLSYVHDKVSPCLED